MDDDAAIGASERLLHGNERDYLVREEALVMEIGEFRILTMRTPGQDEDLVRGFLLSEGLVDDPRRIRGILLSKGQPHEEPGRGPAGSAGRPDRARILLEGGIDPRREGILRRSHPIRPSCGVCGLEDLESLLPEKGAIEPGRPRVETGLILATLERFRRRQGLFHTTGGCHGAALCDREGKVCGFGEDVGRHNALDKALGMAARTGAEPAFALLSGRAGYELVAKLIRRRVPIIVSVSAASALSFDLCREAGATLVGFAREGRLKIYWDEGRLSGPPSRALRP